MEALLLFLLLFAGQSAYLILMSGWHLLVRQYRDVEKPGPVRRISEGSYWANADFHFIPLGARVELYPSGLWLSSPFPVNIFFASVLIPWQDLTLKEGTRKILWFARPASLKVKSWPYRLVVHGQAGTAIRRKLGATD